jgi:hypothetical protein
VALPLLLLAASTLPAGAESASARFTVSAIVNAQVTLEPVGEPARLTLTTEDIARGYKVVSARYQVHQSAGRGYLLHLSPRVGLTRHVEIRGLSGTLLLQDDSLAVYRASADEPQDFALNYRFVLDAAARPGTYALPVHVSATPL